MQLKKALFWEPREEDRVQCNLCSHRCTIRPGRRGLCNVRENRGGVLYSLVYGKTTAQAVDPIEKKPLYHFLPGTKTFSIATRGCNFKCLHCQNCDISQVSSDETFGDNRAVMPEQIVNAAGTLGCRSISYTYTEPTVFYEYASETARLASNRGLRNVFVTNGYITPEALTRLAPSMDAANIDLKFFRDDLYRKVCGARLEPVLDTIRMCRDLDVWIEITTLIIPSYNDSDVQLRQIAAFIAGVDDRIPWHVSAFYPTYKLTDAPPTPPSVLEKAVRIGTAKGLKFIYMGNVNGRSDTLCPSCRATVITRSVFTVRGEWVETGKCPGCGAEIPGIWT
jgi:pyruvate formate lyase activating enzyme